jgi:uncharacterized membrane protein (UPF0127 family)
VNRRVRGWLGIAAAAALLGTGLRPAGVGLAQGAPRGCPVPRFTYKHGLVEFTEGGRTTDVHVEVADTQQMREVGLMCRPSLDPDAGMLFVFDSDTDVPFWMKDTLVPLSIAFIDAGWHIVSLQAMPVAPDPDNPDRVYPPGHPYRYALEVNMGFFTRHGIDTRADVRFLSQGAGTPPAPNPAGSAPPRSP